MRRTAAIATTFTLLAGLLAAPSSAQAAGTPGVLEGTITEYETGKPLPGACARVLSTAWNELATACADADGHYATTPLQANVQFRVQFTATGHADRWGPNEPTVFTSGGYGVTATDGRTLDAALPARAGTVSGRVTDPEGSGESLLYVEARVGGVRKGTARTKADGTYELTGLVPGTYDVVTYGGCLPEVTVAAVVVTDGGSTAVDSHHATRNCTGGNRTFAGKVVDGLTGAAIPNASYRVVAYAFDFEVAAGFSDATGAYLVDGLTSSLNTHRVEVSAPGYAKQWAYGGRTMSMGSPFNPGMTEIPLAPAWGGLQGRVTAPDGQPVKATVTIFGPARLRRSQVTAADGSYSFADLPPGDWTLQIQHATLGTQWYPQVPPSTTTTSAPPNAGHITIVPDTVATLNEQYAERAHVAVTLLDTVTGQPIIDGCVTVYGSSVFDPPAQSCTNANGVYRMDVPPAISGAVNAESPGAFLGNQTGIAMASGQTVPITLRLQPAGTITVPIQHNPDGTIPPVCVLVVPKTTFSTLGSELGPWCNTNTGVSQDSITVGKLSLGPVQLFVWASDASQGSQWLGTVGGTGQREQAAVIDVRRGANTSPVVKLDAAATVWGSVSGQVSGSGLTVLAGGMTPGFHSQCGTNYVYAYCMDNDSAYQLRLGPYAWPLEAYAPSVGLTWSGGAGSRADAQLVQLQAGAYVRYDLTLKPGGDFTLDVPEGTTGWRLETFDARTGDAAGIFVTHTVSSVARGPHLVHAVYTANGSEHSCWLYDTSVPLRKPNPIFYAGFDGQSTRLTIRPGVTCLDQVPSLATPLPRR
ncbi:MAG: hypothetical protein HOU81_07145 [Hamadaea sp.]|uniref:carboxypeptidase regulatory-like domain-containing protein n=1 Tax=Hamadaea sp. TaxID=2024425 RepID=UPI00180741C4|nr:carboxypeptidase regulatory-like domain-containing protein [Hamadaea sp.]NUR70579.1 hypothetical protein [Hamadaea sp.]NUT19292.1 hypothetical protein [Hamadaea sp.]